MFLGKTVLEILLVPQVHATETGDKHRPYVSRGSYADYHGLYLRRHE